MNYLSEAKKVFEKEIEALTETKELLGDAFLEILDAVVACKGKVIMCGMGKSGHIAKKISATLASLGTPSFCLHPAEAMHGDLGMVSKEDFVILISHSGESVEIVNLLSPLKIIGAKLAAITSNEKSTLARECELVQIMPKTKEACGLNLAPTSSTTAVLAYGDALAVVASKIYGFREENFGLFHPAGTLGKKVLLRVEDIMASDDKIPVVSEKTLISDAIMVMSRKRLGVVMIADDDGRLKGLLTDGDLRRAIATKVDMYQDVIDNIMTIEPKYIEAGILAVEALQIMREKGVSVVPVLDKDSKIKGVLSLQMIINAGIVV